MFQSLRQNSQIFILDKTNGTILKKGTVTFVSAPVPKYGITPMYGQQQEMLVDITAKVDNQDVTYQKLPAQAEIADFGNSGIIIADNKQAMNAEVQSLKQRSIDIINSLELHKKTVQECDRILQDLNPELAQKQQQDVEIKEIKNQMSEMTKNMQSLMMANKALMEKLNLKEVQL